MSGDNDTRMKTWVRKWLNEFCVGAANGINAKNSPARTAQNANFATPSQRHAKKATPFAAHPRRAIFCQKPARNLNRPSPFLRAVPCIP